MVTYLSANINVYHVSKARPSFRPDNPNSSTAMQIISPIWFDVIIVAEHGPEEEQRPHHQQQRHHQQRQQPGQSRW